MDNIIYSQTGGIRIGGFNATWPFAKIHIYKDKIILNYSFLFYKETITVKKEDLNYIKPIESFLGPLGRGIKFFHKNDYKKNKIIFWSFNKETLIKKLKEAGYLVKDS